MVCVVIYTSTGLLSLGLADNHIRDDGAAALAQLIRATDTLEVLMLSGNEIGDDGGGILVAALSQNASLKALYLAGVGVCVFRYTYINY